MARIKSYDQDSTLNKADKVLGTDSATGKTKNYTIESILSVANEDNLVEVFDGAAFEFQNYVDPAGDVNGVLNLNAGAATNANFSAINILYISVNDKSGNSLREYLENADNDFIKISKTDNLNQFGIYEVTDIEDYGSNKYKKLTLTPRGTNGTLTVGTKYFVANYSALYDQDFSDDSVTEFGDVTNAGSGQIITGAERTSLNNFTNNGLVHGDVVDNVISTATDVPLSANQGKILKDLIDAINTLLTSDNIDLDTLQEVVDYIEANKETLDALSISSIAGLQDALDLKQNTEAGKGLSANDFTDVLLAKLNSIAENAEVNVNANWSATSGDAFIENKPTDLTNLSIHDVTELRDITSAGSGAIITGAERTKLTGIEAGAEVNVNADWNATSGDAQILNKPALAPSNAEANVQSNWNESDSNSDAFIQNKPTDVTDISLYNVVNLGDVSSAGSGEIITAGERTKLEGIEEGAEVNIKPDWNATLGDDAEILNKPSVASSTTTIEIQGTTDEIEISPVGPQNLSANRTFTVGLPDDVTVGQDLTVTRDATVTENLAVGDTIELLNNQTTTPTFDNGIYYTTEGAHDTLHFRYHGRDISIDKFTEVLPSGILNGGELSTTAGSTTFTIAAGNGIINDLNKSAGSEPHPEIINIEWLEQTITVFNLDSNNSDQLNAWIYIDNTGTVRQQAGAFTEAQFRTHIPVGSIIHTSGTTQFARTFPRTAYNSMSQHNEFIAAFGPLKKSGHAITANGTNLSLDRSSGVAFALGRNYAIDPENPSTVSDGARAAALIHRYYSNGSGGFVKDNNAGAGYTGIDPTKYDDGTGTLATHSSGSYTVQRLFYFPGTPNILISYYGKDTYSSLDTAERSYLLESFQEDDNTAQQAIYVGAVIMKGNTTALNDPADAKILIAGQFRSLAATNLGGVAASAAIGDLTDVSITGVSNDHFLRYNSSSTNWENTAITSDDIAEGTSNLYYPAADSTKVGFIGVTQAVDLDTIESDTAANNSKVSFPGFGTVAGTALEGNTQLVDGTGAANKLAIWSDIDTLTNDTNLHWDTTNDRLGIGTASPSQKLHVDGNVSLGKYSGSDFDKRIGLNDAAGAYGAGSSYIEFEELSGTGTANLNKGGNIRFHNHLFGGGTNETLTLLAKGNVGIGTSSPDVRLEVVEASPTNGIVADFVNSTNAGGTTAAIKLSNADSDSCDVVLGANRVNANFGSDFFISLSDSVDGSNQERFRITEAGNVGIGTPAPNTSLHINATDAIIIPKGTDTERNALAAESGMFRFNTTDNEFEGYNGTEWGAIGGSGGGGGTGEIVKETFSGTGSQASFNLSDTIVDIDNINVYVDGVYQYPSNYTVSGNTVTFASGSIPASGTDNVHIRHNVTAPTLTEGAAFSTSGSLTGDGSTTTFALGGTPRSSDHTMVFLEGVYQEKENYSISGSNIVFTTAPPNGYSIEVKYVSGLLDLTDVGEIVLDELTGDGTATYVLSSAPLSENYTNVYIEGVYQEKGTYSVAGSNIVFSSNVPTGYSIEVSIYKTIPSGSVTQTTFQTDTFTANGTQTNFALVNGSPASKALTMVFIQGVYQAKSNYNLVSNEIQFTAGTPAEDDVIEVISMSAINTASSSVTSVNGEVGAVTVQSKHSVSVIGADTNAVANTVYVFTANLNLTLPASPGLGDSIKISNLSGVDTCVLGSNGNKIMDAAADLTLDTASASFELIWSGSSKGWVIIGQ